MKKGIVMEKHKKYTIIMTKEGVFHKAIPIENAMIGAEVSYKSLELEKKAKLFFFPSKKINVRFQLLATVCVLLLLALPFYFLMGTSKTYAYVNIDINPSIELEIDEELLVRSIRPLNNDAKIILKQLESYEDVKLQTVIERIMDKTAETGLTNNNKNMLLGVSYTADKNEKISILDNLERFLLKNNTEWEIAAFNVPLTVREEANKKNKSMNEVMASTIIRTDQTKAINKKRDESMDDKDRAIIQSFYNTDNNHSKDNTLNDTIEITPKETKNNSKPMKIEKNQEENIKRNKEKNTKEKTHPSELKGKNGAINSNGKNKAKHNNNREKKNDNGKDKANKHQHKDMKKNHKNENKHKHKKYQNKHKNNGNGKDRNNEQGKFDSNGHGKYGNNGKGKHDNNGQGKHKNNGNGKHNYSGKGNNNGKGHNH